MNIKSQSMEQINRFIFTQDVLARLKKNKKNGTMRAY